MEEEILSGDELMRSGSLFFELTLIVEGDVLVEEREMSKVRDVRVRRWGESSGAKEGGSGIFERGRVEEDGKTKSEVT